MRLSYCNYLCFNVGLYDDEWFAHPREILCFYLFHLNASDDCGKKKNHAGKGTERVGPVLKTSRNINLNHGCFGRCWVKLF